MIKKTLAGFATAAMLLPVGFVTASPASAQSSSRCSFSLVAPDGATASSVVVDVYWQYRNSDSGTLVKPSSVIIFNGTGRSITFTVNRWQNYAGTTVNRGPSGTIGNNTSVSWTPPTWIPRNQNPFVNVGAAATTRSGMNGSTICAAP